MFLSNYQRKEQLKQLLKNIDSIIIKEDSKEKVREYLIEEINKI